MINSFFNIFPTQNAAVRWKEHVLSSDNVAGAQPILEEKPEENLLLGQTGTFPNFEEDRGAEVVPARCL